MIERSLGDSVPHETKARGLQDSNTASAALLEMSRVPKHVYKRLTASDSLDFNSG